MEPCPECGCRHIGIDVLYTHGVARFCQNCGHKGPRVHIEPDEENWFAVTEADATVAWNQMAQSMKLRQVDGGYEDLRFSA